MTAEIAVTVKTSLEPFSDSQIEDIFAITENTIWAASCTEPTSNGAPQYWSYSYYKDRGVWTDEDQDDMHVLGWWLNMWGSDYGGMKIYWKAGAQVGEEVEGNFDYRYTSRAALYTYGNKPKVLEDNEPRTVVSWW